MSSRLYSIIIAGYKDTVRETLQGALALQVASDVAFEVILLDNTRDGRHRTMADAEFARAAPGMRTVYLHHAVPGKAAAQNRAIAEARGDHYVFLDDDVLPDPDLVLAYDRAFQSHACGAVQGRVTLRFEEGAIPPPWLNARFRLDLAEMDFGRPVIPFEMGLTGANMAFKASLFTRFGGFDERLGTGRSGTLEDQEYSERIRAGGEVQLFWPEASVQHRIPPRRLQFRSFAGIYFDVGHSDFFLSRHYIKGGRVKFTVYSMKEALILLLRAAFFALRRRRSEALHALCGLFRIYGYWKQAWRHL